MNDRLNLGLKLKEDVDEPIKDAYFPYFQTASMGGKGRAESHRLELFKKTLPTPSLMQLKTSGRAMMKRALLALQQANQGEHDFRINLIALALKGKKVSFAKVLKMVDDMVTLLGKEQNDDNDKKEYCENLIDKTEDNLKELELSVSDLGKTIANHKEQIATLTEELEALADGIKALDKQESAFQRSTEYHLSCRPNPSLAPPASPMPHHFA